MATPRGCGDEEAQRALINDEKKQEELAKLPVPAWLNHNGESSVALFTIVSALLVQLLSGYKSVEELDNIVTILLGWILFMVYIFSGILMFLKRDISSKVKRAISPTTNQKIILTSLNLLTDFSFMVANVLLLGMVEKSYLCFVSIPVVGSILVAALFYFDPKQDQEKGGTEDQEKGGTKDNEYMVKNCFKVGNAATLAGYVVQTTVCIGYMKYPNFQKDHPDQYIVIVPFLISCVGSFARTVTSSPLQLQSDLMCCFLKQITNGMLILLGLGVVLLSAQFLDAIKVVFAVVIPCSEMIVVSLYQRSLKEKEEKEQKETGYNSKGTESGEEEVDPMFVALAGIGTTVLSAIYSVKFMSEGHTTYLTYSVFFLLSSTVSSLMRMVFLSRPVETVITYVHDALPMTETLVGLALLLTEICTYITKVRKAGVSIPVLGPISSLHH